MVPRALPAAPTAVRRAFRRLSGPAFTVSPVTSRLVRGPQHADPQTALAAVRAALPRPGIELEEMDSPTRIAPTSLAFSGQVVGGCPEEPLATGRFVLLHDPEAPEEWEGPWRVVVYVGAQVEPELATDPLFAEVGAEWLREALAMQHCTYVAESGTVTRSTSTAFGAREEQAPQVELEIRASWTPLDRDLLRHLEAWRDLLAMVGGTPPVPTGVTPLRGAR